MCSPRRRAVPGKAICWTLREGRWSRTLRDAEWGEALGHYAILWLGTDFGNIGYDPARNTRLRAMVWDPALIGPASGECFPGERSAAARPSQSLEPEVRQPLDVDL